MIAWLPPLAALRAFEAAARHMSFKAAAGELNLTPSAVSHRIASLEEHLGVKLFHRLNRNLQLSDVGRHYLGSIQQAFAQIDVATRQVKFHGGADVLTIHSTPTFASLWLMPRLSDFIAGHPKLDVRVYASPAPANFINDSVDIDVRYGRPAWPDVHVVPVMTEAIRPLCSPRLLPPEGRLAAPADLARETLIHSVVNVVQWDDWLAANGVTGIDTSRGPQFDRSLISIQAAVDGLGIALESSNLAKQEVLRGRLVDPFKGRTQPVQVQAHFLALPRHYLDRPKVADFLDWIRGRILAEEASS